MSWAPDYATLQELKDFVRIIDLDDDVQLSLAITAASRAVDRATGRQFGLVAAPEARYFTAFYNAVECLWSVDVDDVMIVTGFEVASDNGGDDSFSTSLTSYTLLPRNAVVKGRPYTRLRFTSGTPTDQPDATRVTARWGWSAVPDTIKQATLLQASRFFARRNSPFGVAGSPDQGTELRLLAKVDPDVQVMLSSYVRWWGAR